MHGLHLAQTSDNHTPICNLIGRAIELTFDALQGVFVGQLEGSDTAIPIAPQGLTKADLMGELSGLLALPAYQLTLPFTQTAWRQLEYAHILTSTTL
jgi:hypothetical protein